MAPKQHFVVGTACPEGDGVLTLRIAAPQWVASGQQPDQAQPPAEAPGAAGVEPTLSPPDPKQLHLSIQNGDIAASETKRLRTVRQLQSHLAYLQRQQGLPTGLCGGWNASAQQKLDAWLLADLKGSRGNSPATLSIEDGAAAEPGDHVSSDGEGPAKKKQKGLPDEGVSLKSPEPDPSESPGDGAQSEQEPSVKSPEPDPSESRADGAQSEQEPSSSSTSSSTSSERVKTRRANLDKALSCLDSFEEVNPDCADCSQMVAQAKKFIKACY